MFRVLALVIFAQVAAMAYGVPDPFIDITTTNSIVTYDVLTTSIAGTNSVDTNAFFIVIGDMFWTNVAASAGGSFAADTDWTVLAIPLVVGSNVITVSGTNSVNVSTNDSVIFVRGAAGTGVPFVNVLSTNSYFTYDITNATVTGTNNENVVGVMLWTNTVTLESRSFTVASNWTSGVIPLSAGANIITVYGTNVYGVAVDDSVTYTRGAIGTGVPFVDIAQTNSSLTYDTDSITISGTNNLHVVGTMTLTNSLTTSSANFPATPNWTAGSISLGVGSNVITVIGTNSAGVATNDSITCYRGVVGTGIPDVEVLGTNYGVNYGITNATISGTNNAQVVGDMTWTNSLTGEIGTFSAAQSWSFTANNLAIGGNPFGIYGTNLLGFASTASLIIARSFVDSMEEFIVVDFDGVGPREKLFNNSVKTFVVQLLNHGSNINATGYTPYFYIAAMNTNRNIISGICNWRSITSCAFTVTYASNMIGSASGEWIYGCGLSNNIGVTTFNQGPMGINPDPWR